MTDNICLAFKYFRYTCKDEFVRRSPKNTASARSFFQEYNVDLLDIDQHAPLIIERILAYGNRTEIRWLLETYGREQELDWVFSQESTDYRGEDITFGVLCLIFQ